MLNLLILNSLGNRAYLAIDMERLGAPAIEGVWLRARVRNGGVGLTDEKVNEIPTIRQCQVLTTPPEPGVLHRGE
jgi:hypothetical protein